MNANALDRHITGNYGEDYFQHERHPNDIPDPSLRAGTCGHIVNIHGKYAPYGLCSNCGFKADMNGTLPEPLTMPARCIECGAVEQVPLDDVDPRERHLTMVETCCDACLARIDKELKEDAVARYHPTPTKRERQSPGTYWIIGKHGELLAEIYRINGSWRAIDINLNEIGPLYNTLDQATDSVYHHFATTPACDTCHYLPCQCDSIPQESDPNPFVRGIALFALLLAFLALTSHPAAARDYPPIGPEYYNRSCAITQAWEDGSAIAYCWEDGASYVFDPDGDPMNDTLPGWYVLDEERAR